MPYNPSRISEVVSLEEMREYVQEELEKISKEFNETIALDLRAVHREPGRPREGMIVSADGTDWNPGAGAGAYEYVGGVWRRVAGLQAADYGDVVVDGSGNMTIDNNVVTLAKLADIATARILGRVTAGTGDPEALTGTQTTTLLDIFTSALKGLVPASGGGTTTFLRADGTFAAPTSAITRAAAASVGTGTTYTISSIPAHTLALLQLINLSHNNGAAQNFRIELSANNGSSWSTAQVLTAAAVAAATNVTFNVIISHDASYNYSATIGVLSTSGANSPLHILGAQLNAIRISPSAGNFDAGRANLHVF